MRQRTPIRLFRHETLQGYLFISPWLLGLLLFTVAPMLASLYLAFTHYNILTAPQWAGLDNFSQMFTGDERYWKSWRATLAFVFGAVPLRLLFALITAMLLNQKIRMLGFFRTAYYLPTLLGGSVAIAVIWRQLFGSSGALNSLLEIWFGTTGNISWITHPATTMYSLIGLSVWQFGSAMIIFLAGLKQIPQPLYEAAAIDGAGWRHRLFKITLPLLTPVILFNLIMGVINGFKVFTEGLIITGGGPFDKTLFYVLYLYEQSFRYYNMGYGSAMAWVLLLVTGLCTGVLFATSRKWVFYE